MKKTLIGLMAAAAIFGGAATIAEARTNFSIYFGIPYFDEQIGPDYRYYNNRGWYLDRDYNYGRRYISCTRARSIVRNQGYRNVVARDCQGQTYSFSTRRNNSSARVIVYVNARTGRISRG